MHLYSPVLAIHLTTVQCTVYSRALDMDGIGPRHLSVYIYIIYNIFQCKVFI